MGGGGEKMYDRIFQIKIKQLTTKTFINSPKLVTLYLVPFYLYISNKSIKYYRFNRFDNTNRYQLPQINNLNNYPKYFFAFTLKIKSSKGNGQVKFFICILTDSVENILKFNNKIKNKNKF